MKFLIMALSALSLVQTALATEVIVTLSDAFADELAETYGEREGAVLKQEVLEDIDRAFSRKGVAPTRVEITIVKARPNRPTRAQSRANPSLDIFRSVSLGGMNLEGVAYDADGARLAEQTYGWFENNIYNASAAGTWSDAKRASRRFARKFADTLAAH